VASDNPSSATASVRRWPVNRRYNSRYNWARERCLAVAVPDSVREGRAVFEPERKLRRYSRNRSRLAIRRCNDGKENPRIFLENARAPWAMASFASRPAADIVADRSRPRLPGLWL